MLFNYKMIKVLLLISSIVYSIQQSLSLEHVEVRRSIIDSYMEGSPKELFKVFHYIFEKPYNLNSEAAIAKYRVFKKNLSMIKEHNSKGLSWTLEVNAFADMTQEEINAYMGLAPVGTETNIESLVSNKNFDLFDDLVEREERRKLKELSFFEQFADNDDDDPVPPQVGNSTLPVIDHSAYLTPARSQGSCGSCWAFSTAGAVESNYNIVKNQTSVNETGYISPQAILDCNPSKYGCSGGWMNFAMRHVATSGAVREKEYPYQTIQNPSCKNATTISDLKFNSSNPVEGCAWTTWFDRMKPCTKNSFYNILAKGPVSVVLMAETNFSYYRSGTIDASKIADCSSYNHAVLAFAWVTETDKDNNVREVIRIRNSWGQWWGDRGNIKYYYDENGSCFITKLAMRPNLI